MPITLDDGVNDNEDPTLLAASVLSEGTGLEYRVGSSGIHTARGRESRGSVSSATLRALYQAGFDNGQDYLVVQAADTYQYALIGTSMSFTSLGLVGTGTSRMVGTHFANRHYVVNGASNVALEFAGGDSVSLRVMGMTKPSHTIGVTVSGASGSMTASTGLTYWSTEYDSGRGLESIYGMTSASTGAFSSRASVELTLAVSPTNTNADRLRIYRTTDGGVFPDGGFLADIPIGQTGYSDTSASTGTALTPGYGVVSVGGLDFDRDEQPEPMMSVVQFENSLAGFPTDSRRSLRYSVASRPESWPTIYDIPLQSSRQDIGMVCVRHPSGLGVFTRDTIHRVTRLPRETDSAFAASEAATLISDERGSVSLHGAVLFTWPSQGVFVAFVSRDGVWATNLLPGSVFPLADTTDWSAHVDPEALESCSLANDALNRRLVLCYRKPGSTVNNGIMYLDYQRDFIRVTHPDHGALADLAIGPFRGELRLFSADSRGNHGGVYTETVKDSDDSNFGDGSGSVNFALKTAEILPAGAHASARVGVAAWMHGQGPRRISHEFFYDRFEHASYVQADFSSRDATEVGLTRDVNSLSLRLSGAVTASFAIHWLDIEGLETAPLGSRPGA